VVLSVAHSGRNYPSWLVDMASRGKPALSDLEDPFVDRLVWRAMKRGCGAVIAQTPRAAVDFNRAEDEVDPSVVDGARHGRLTARARGGLGIVPARTLQNGYLWRRVISTRQLEERLEQAHRPYHRAIEEQLSTLVHMFDCALLLDCHSMPPPPEGVPEIIFGDRRGRTAHGWISKQAAAVAARYGYTAGLNDPFAGGHIIERHARPVAGIHALQIEIDRRCYLDARLKEPGEGFDRIAALIEALAVELGEALLDARTATAAE
jgi:N-formylglutamate amidohydrolase